MNTIEYHTDGDSLTKAITKYAERETQIETRMSQMEATFEEELFMMKMQQPPQQQYYQQQPPLPPLRHNQCPRKYQYQQQPKIGHDSEKDRAERMEERTDVTRVVNPILSSK